MYLPQNDPPDPSRGRIRTSRRKVQKQSDQSNAETGDKTGKTSDKTGDETSDKTDDVPLPGPTNGLTLGSKIEVETNYFTVTMMETNPIHLYNISFCPGYEPGSRRRERRMLQILMDRCPMLWSAATDYKQLLISKTPLTQNQTSTSLGIDFYEFGDPAPQPGQPHTDTCRVRIDYNKSLSLAELQRYLADAANGGGYRSKEETVDTLNVLFGRFPNQANHIPDLSKPKIFNTNTPNRERSVLRGGLEVYLGFEKSTRASPAGLLLNVNAITSAFYQEIRFDALIDDWSGYGLGSPHDRNRKWQYAHNNAAALIRFLKGVRVRATYGQRRFYSIWGIPTNTTNPASSMSGAV
jgi:N-terminal domain of argonaute/Argonaute linker 1 domain